MRVTFWVWCRSSDKFGSWVGNYAFPIILAIPVRRILAPPWKSGPCDCWSTEENEGYSRKISLGKSYLPVFIISCKPRMPTSYPCIQLENVGRKLWQQANVYVLQTDRRFVGLTRATTAPSYFRIGHMQINGELLDILVNKPGLITTCVVSVQTREAKTKKK